MSTKRTSTPWLLAGVVVLGGIVLYRQFVGASPAAGGASVEEPTARERYLEALAESNRQKRLVESGGRWKDALAATRDVWDRTSRELVRGRTQELAEAGFRERVLAEVKDLKFAEATANTVKIEAAPAPSGASASSAAAASSSATVRTIGLKVEVRADSPAEVYRLIDRLEHMPDARAGVVAVEVKGPGLAQSLGEVSATITVQALALIGEAPQ